ncbi:MAG TPA: hypothetical protein DDX54_03760 [Rhodospirillaceae bacterium]|jgi:hypothetical protein|nr:AAA family ATPase [Alphaproteobacteria bacterium]HBH26499.1 hypothetical protein [Rhodospirillaceae bacterium]
MLSNTVLYLIGFPGTGKATIARAVCAQAGPEMRLVDSHLINGPLYEVAGQRGPVPIPPELWARVHPLRVAMRGVLLDAMVHLAPPERSFIFTNVLVKGDAEDRAMYAAVESAAAARGAAFVPVLLRIDPAEHARRIVGADRSAALKLTDPAVPARYAAGPGLIRVDHPNLLDLDATHLSAQDAAARILAHAVARAAP